MSSRRVFIRQSNRTGEQNAGAGTGNAVRVTHEMGGGHMPWGTPLLTVHSREFILSRRSECCNSIFYIPSI